MKQIRDTRYSVCEDGRVYNEKGHLMSTWVANTGYLKVRLYLEGIKLDCYVHILVAENYVPNPNGHPQVMHRNNNKLDCHYSNLIWGTNSQNTKAAYDDGCYQFKNRSHRIKAVNKETGEELFFNSVRQADDILGYNRKTITSILKGTKQQNNFDHDFFYDMPND